MELPLPPELQEKILQETIKQKIQDKKRMGWGKIHKAIKCKCLEHFNVNYKRLIVLCCSCKMNGIVRILSPNQQFYFLKSELDMFLESFYASDSNKELEKAIFDIQECFNKI